ncbi:hypothetical protein ACVIGB_008488 [Bradyrhizobium sp. USDA 4341]
MRPGSRRSGNTQDNFAAKPRRRSAMARSMTPPSDVSLPPSNEAVIFLRETAGNENGRLVSSVMASVAARMCGGWVLATESYATSAAYATLASLSTIR